jgi:hypothetical protein
LLLGPSEGFIEEEGAGDYYVGSGRLETGELAPACKRELREPSGKVAHGFGVERLPVYGSAAVGVELASDGHERRHSAGDAHEFRVLGGSTDAPERRPHVLPGQGELGFGRWIAVKMPLGEPYASDVEADGIGNVEGVRTAVNELGASPADVDDEHGALEVETR